MLAADDARTYGKTRLSFASEADIDEFVETLGRFERGEMSADAWRAFRLVRGVYGQRQVGDVQMIRAKIPQGVIDASQFEALADVAERHSRGFAHITTRQNIQFHFVALHELDLAMHRLADAGLTTREACGNTVRNITACPYAGVAADEVFDVTPYAEALTRHLLRHPLASGLPRKFKIGFEGCPTDHARAAINDLGWYARVRKTGDRIERGFKVTIGGGTSILCQTGQVLYDFAPAGEMIEITEAVLRVYQRLGDYQHRQRNRLKFLIRSLGWERWRELFEISLAEARAEGVGRLPFDPDHPPVEPPPVLPDEAAPPLETIAATVAATRVKGPGILPTLLLGTPVNDEAIAHWRRTNVRSQRQSGFATVVVTIPLGDVTAGQFRAIALLARGHGDGTVRVTPEQNLLFRWVRDDQVAALHAGLTAAGLAVPGAGTLADVTSCPGAETCRLAVTQSRGLAQALRERCEERPDLAAAAGDLDVKISGCPNGCGQHHVAGIGFQGSVRKVNGRAVPQYFVMVGGGVQDEAAHFARLAAKIPARRCADAMERLVSLYRDERAPDESGVAFFHRIELARVKALLADLAVLSPDAAHEDDYVDLGEQAAFHPEVMEGECSA